MFVQVPTRGGSRASYNWVSGGRNASGRAAGRYSST